MAYTVRAATYRGQRDVQIEWIDYRMKEERPIQLQASKPPVHIVDYRQEERPISILAPMIPNENLQVWCEALSEPVFTGLDRYKLKVPCKILVIWTIPPGPAELHTVLERTMPESVLTFGIDPGLDRPEAFLKRLAGLVKYALKNNQGNLRLSELAAASAHHIRTVSAGIDWLEAHGHISILEQESDELVVQKGQDELSKNARQTAQQLKTLLEETAAYRTYYLKTDINALINL
jgi:hypothetical protein